MKRFAQIAFALIAIATVFEFLFVYGTFTGPLAMALVWIVGIHHHFLQTQKVQ